MLSFINEVVGFMHPFSKLDGLGGEETPGLGMFICAAIISCSGYRIVRCEIVSTTVVATECFSLLLKLLLSRTSCFSVALPNLVFSTTLVVSFGGGRGLVPPVLLKYSSSAFKDVNASLR